MAKSRIMTIPSADHIVEQRELSFIAAGDAKSYSHFGKRVVISYKTKHILTIWFSNYAPWYLFKGVEYLCPYKNLHMFTTILFIIAKTWKQPRYPLAGEWTINCSISSTKMNELSNHEKT